MSRFPDIPPEAVLKEDLLRTGIAFDDSALTDNLDGEVKPKSYFIFSFDQKPLAQLGEAAKRRPPEELALTGGPYALRRTIVSVRVNPSSPYRVSRGEAGELRLVLEGREIANAGLPPMPEYYRHTLANGKTVMETAPTIQWGYLIYLTVLRLCQYFGAKEECGFCDINHNWRQHKREGRPYTGVKPVEDVLEALTIIDRYDTAKASKAYTLTGGSVTSTVDGLAEADFYGRYAQAIASTTEGLDYFMSRGITPRFTTWCPEPTTPLGRDNPDGAPLEYHVRLLEAYRDSVGKHGLKPPPGYGVAGAGNAVFSVSSFMDALPAEEPVPA